MNNQIKNLMLEAGYAAPEIAGRAQVFSQLLIKDCIRILHNNGYDDAAKCLSDVHFGTTDSV
jgi:hypothetical protein